MYGSHNRRAAAALLGGGGGGGGFTGPYDAIPDITAAYGMRRLLSSYESNLVRIRRSSDNAEQDFGYTASGDLDTAGIATFVGAGSGFVVTWYDQSGNGNDATQATAASQPLHVASGQNSRPVLRWDGSDSMTHTGNAITGQALTLMIVAKLNATALRLSIYSTRGASDAGSWQWEYGIGSGGTNRLCCTTAGNFLAQTPDNVYTPNAWSLATYRREADKTNHMYVNGAEKTPLTLGTNIDFATNASNKIISGGAGAGSVLGDIAEFVIVDAALTDSDRQAAESAAASYWSIY